MRLLLFGPNFRAGRSCDLRLLSFPEQAEKSGSRSVGGFGGTWTLRLFVVILVGVPYEAFLRRL